jgi:hypothetical protein
MSVKPDDEEQVMRRAYAAWFRYGGTAQPGASDSTIEEYAGRDYVVLRNGRGVMAVYRIRPNGALKGMRRWPAAVSERPADLVDAN